MNDNTILFSVTVGDIRNVLDCDNPNEAEIERVCSKMEDMSFSDTADFICDCLIEVRDEVQDYE